MRKYALIKYATYLVSGKFFLPILFDNLPYPFNLNMFWVVMLVAVTLFVYPGLFKEKILFPIYVLVLYYLFVIKLFPYYKSSESLYYEKLGLSLISTILIFLFYIKIASKKDREKFIKINFVLIIISCLTSVVGFYILPESIRFNHIGSFYSEAQGIERAQYFQSVGIQPYAFFYGLVFIIPPIFYFLKSYRWKNFKNRQLKMYLILFFLYFSIIKSNYVTAFLIASLGFILSFLGAQKYYNYRPLVFSSIVFVFFIPSSFWGEVVANISSLTEESSTLNLRLLDLSNTLSGEEETHVSGRLDRIPFLIDSFLENPLIGTGYQTSHNFLLDVLSAFGMLGFIWYVWLYYSIYKTCKTIFNRSSFFYFLLSFYLFLIYIPIKGAPSGLMYYFLFALGPLFILVAQEYQENRVNQPMVDNFHNN